MGKGFPMLSHSIIMKLAATAFHKQIRAIGGYTVTACSYTSE